MIVAAHQRSTAPYALVSISLLAAVLLVRVPSGLAALDGYIGLTAVQSRTGDESQNTLRQDYNVAWSKGLAPYVDFRLAMRYFKFDLENDVNFGSWREEFQPSGELLWKHPDFSFVTSAYRRRAEASLLSGNVTTDNWLAAFSTRNQRYPLFSIRYDSHHIYDNIAGFERDTYDKRFRTGLDYLTRRNNLSYAFTHRNTDNVVSGVETSRDDHIFRWHNSSTPLRSGRLQILLNYTLNYSTQTDRLTGQGMALEILPIARGLYAEDLAPSLGELDPVTGLTDGNTANPTDPVIDIGGAAAGRNIGAELGFAQPVSAIYLYTDRISGIQPQWRVFISADNLSWQQWSASPQVLFNAALSRYEIGFPAVTTTYIKVVKEGLNEVPVVNVTEIQAFQALEIIGEDKRDGRTNYVDFHAGYDFTDWLDGAVDVSYRKEDAPALFGDRSYFDYSLRARARHSGVFSHHLRWGQSFQDLAEGIPDVQDNTGAYTLLVQPLESLGGSLSFSGRRAYINHLKDNDVWSALAEINGTPFPDLNMSVSLGRSIIEQYLADRRNESWNVRFSFDGAFTRWLTGIFSYAYRHIRLYPEDFLRQRRLYSIGFNVKLSRTIFARATINLVDDILNNTTQDYIFSWNLTPKLALIGQAYVYAAEGGFDSNRYSVNLHYDLSSRSIIYLRYASFDFASAGGLTTTSWQQGIRIGF